MATNAPQWVKPRNLRVARERLGLTPKEVAEQSALLEKEKHYALIEADRLVSWESGDDEPALEHLETLSEIYVRPVGHFFLPALPSEESRLSYRGLSPDKTRETKPALQQTLRRFEELAEWTASLIGDLGVGWTSTIQAAGQVRVDGDFEELIEHERARLGYTQSIRHQWSTTEAAFQWWRRAVESQGIFCFQMKLDARDVRGASAWIADQYPFILVNHEDDEAAAGRLFTLLHEYGHLLAHERGVVCDFRGATRGLNPEPWANRFAARMLLSHRELVSQLDRLGLHDRRERWGDEALDGMREPFHVSRDVIAIMLEELALAPDGFYRGKRAMWEKRKPRKGWGKGGGSISTNVKALRRLGFSLAHVLSRPDREESLPWSDLAYVLDMKVEKADEFLRWVRDEGDLGNAV